MVRYPVTLTPDDNDTILVTFPDFPEAATFGADREEALARAVDALETVIDAYIRDKRPIPTASATAGETVALPTLVDVKTQLYAGMRRRRVNKTNLAQRMNVHLPQIDRLLDVRHGSTIEQLDAAAKALGGHLDVVLIVPDGPEQSPVFSGSDVARVAQSAKRVRARSTAAKRMPPRVHAGVLTASKRARGRRELVGGKKK